MQRQNDDRIQPTKSCGLHYHPYDDVAGESIVWIATLYLK